MSKDVDKLNCPFCPNLFKAKFPLYVHLRGHTLERPFPCPTPSCSKRFRIKSDLKAHVRLLHRPNKKTSTGTCNTALSKSVRPQSVKLERTESDSSRSQPSSSSSDQDSTSNENWKSPRIGSVSPPKPKGFDKFNWIAFIIFILITKLEIAGPKGLNFIPSAIWYQCQICKVLIEHRDKFILHKRTKHPPRSTPPES